MESGADPNIKDLEEGRTALSFAAERSHRQTCALLIEYGANPSLRDKRGKVAADYANDKTARSIRNAKPKGTSLYK